MEPNGDATVGSSGRQVLDETDEGQLGQTHTGDAEEGCGILRLWASPVARGDQAPVRLRIGDALTFIILSMAVADNVSNRWPYPLAVAMETARDWPAQKI